MMVVEVVLGVDHGVGDRWKLNLQWLKAESSAETSKGDKEDKTWVLKSDGCCENKLKT